MSDSHGTILELNQLSCGYGHHKVVSDLTIHLKTGEIGCLLGPSGCGKTTTLRAMAGFEPITAGEIRLAGEVLSSPTRRTPPEQRRIGMVFQDYALFPHLTVHDNVAFGIAKHPERKRIVDELLELVKLAPLGRRYPHELSGGQQQRVALARAWHPIPSCYCSTSPSPIWMVSSGVGCQVKYGKSSRCGVSVPCWSPTIRVKPLPSVITSVS